MFFHVYLDPRPRPLNRVYSPSIVNLEHMFFVYKTELGPAGCVVNKLGLGGVGVGPQQNRNSHMASYDIKNQNNNKKQKKENQEK